MSRGSSGFSAVKNARYASLDSVIQGRFEKVAQLNGSIQGEVIKTASLDAYTSLYTTYELSASLNANVFSSTLLLGLVSYWKLDGNGTDSVGSNNATPNSITFSAGKINQCAVGSGSGYLDAGATNLNLPVVSIAAWVKMNSSNYWFFVTRCVANGVSQSVYELRTDPSLNLQMLGPGGAGVTSSVSLGTGVWRHVVGTRDAGNVYRVYIDGVLCGTASGPAPSSLPSQPTVLGTRDDRYTYMNFSMDEVGIWNRALTDAEVVELYNRSLGQSYPFGSNAPISTTLSAYWAFENNYADSVGAYAGTGTNVTFAAGKNDQSAVFNGTSSRVTIPALSCGTNFTVAGWIYPTSGSINWQTIIGQDTNNAIYRRPSGAIEFYNSGGSTSTTPLNQWSHVAVVVNNGSLRYFINGTKDVFTGSHGATTMNIIGYSNSGSEFFQGNIDELGVWTRPLLDSEITELYNSGAGIYYPF